MYLNHFGLNEPPFRITPHTDFFFSGANRGATLEALLYAITHDEGIIKVSGEVGSGKTMLCRVLMERLPQQAQTILLANPALSRDEILYAIAEELELGREGARLSVLLLALQEHLIALYGENKRVVLLIDEAHAMPQETLEQIRLLSNLETGHAKLLQIVLFGQPELDAHLGLPQMRPLKERITQSFRLEPLVRSDVEAYIDFRMRAAGYRGPKVFSQDAVRRIVKASEGLTRRVNILADKSLLAAFADNQHGISAKHVERAIRDADFKQTAFGNSRLNIAALGGTAGLALGLGLSYLYLQPAQTQPSLQPQTAADRPEAIAAPKAEPAASAVPPAAAADVSAATTTAEAAAAAPATDSGGKAATASADAKAEDKPVPPADKTAEVEPAPPPNAGRRTRARFAATQEWLRNAPGDHYSIQIFTSGNNDLHIVEDMLAHAVDRKLKLEDFYVYGVKIDDRQHYRLAYGLYGDYSEAGRALKNLPQPYKQFRPYLRSVDRMRSQNRQ